MKKFTIWAAAVFTAALMGAMLLACGPTIPKGPNEAGEYTVTFDEHYSGAPAPTEVLVMGGGKASSRAVSRTGYTFDGWYTDKACTDANKFDFANTEITKHLTLYAKWIEITYTVTFSTVYGTAPPPQTGIRQNETATKPADPDGGNNYGFQGWYSGEALFNFDTPITANITLTAKWLVYATGKLATPDDRFICIDGAGNLYGTPNAIEIEKGGANVFDGMGGFSVPGMAYVKIHVYRSNTAGAEPVGAFKVYQNRASSLDDSKSVTGEESEYQAAGNWWILDEELAGLLRDVLGTEYVSGTNYYFRAQFMAVNKEGDNFDSDIGAFTAAGQVGGRNKSAFWVAP